jgi:hypothetical protein
VVVAEQRLQARAQCVVDLATQLPVAATQVAADADATVSDRRP